MPNKLKYTFVFGFLFVFGFGSSWLVSNYSGPEQSRILASAENLAPSKMEKHLMPLVLSVDGPEVFPDDPRQPVTLKATLRTPFSEFAVINYKWILPDDVEVVKGYSMSEIQSPVANQIYEIEITVKGFNNLDRKDISFIATTVDPTGTRLGNSAIITSRPQDSMEHLAPVVMLKAQEFKANQSEDRMPASVKED